MNIIEEKRESIIRDNNTAQEKITNLLELYDRSITELHINEPLHGDLDLSVFHELGFDHIKKIYLGKGEITNIRNYPKSLLVFECVENLLVEISGLPDGIHEINFQYNYLKHVDLEGLSKLFKVNLSHNKIEDIENIPVNIEELYCENNYLKSLDLAKTQKLRILHVSQNINLILENVPKSLVDLKMEDNPFTEITYQELQTNENESGDDDTLQKKMTYNEGVNMYFYLKNKYESEFLEAKKAIINNPVYQDENGAFLNGKKRMKLAKQIKPKCINCQRPVGSIFAITDKQYTAICGDTNPQTKCRLNIKIERGTYNHEQELLYLFRESLEEIKEKIISQKLNTLFNYMSEKQAASLFKEELEEYNTNSSMYKTLYENYNQLHYDPHRKELILRKQEHIFKLMDTVQSILDEYKKTNNKETLRNAVEIQVDELIPEMENLRRLKYEWTDVEITQKYTGGFGRSTIEIKNRLVQRDVNLSKNDYTFGAIPEIINFQYGRK